ncbi:MAG: hypothetical protein RL462_326 [Pseudomonadota bacterium]|jgi:c-di-GMP-binding flagellar brake protein YcgR
MTQTEQLQTAEFADMDLRIGQRVQLILLDPYEEKHYTQLIGYVDNEFVMLQIPQAKGWDVPLREGQSVDVRLFSGVSIFQFSTRIKAILLNPRNYVLLNFPETVQKSRLRSHARVPVSLPVRMTHLPDEQQHFQILDLSSGGASLAGPAKLGEIGDAFKLALSFHLDTSGQLENFEVEATIQNIDLIQPTNSQAVVFKHGLKFTKHDPRVVLYIYELQQVK